MTILSSRNPVLMYARHNRPLRDLERVEQHVMLRAVEIGVVDRASRDAADQRNLHRERDLVVIDLHLVDGLIVEFGHPLAGDDASIEDAPIRYLVGKEDVER